MPSTATPGFAWLRLANARSSAEDEELLALNGRAGGLGSLNSLFYFHLNSLFYFLTLASADLEKTDGLPHFGVLPPYLRWIYPPHLTVTGLIDVLHPTFVREGGRCCLVSNLRVAAPFHRCSEAPLASKYHTTLLHKAAASTKLLSNTRQSDESRGPSVFRLRLRKQEQWNCCVYSHRARTRGRAATKFIKKNPRGRNTLFKKLLLLSKSCCFRNTRQSDESRGPSVFFGSRKQWELLCVFSQSTEG
jgi:hypothetical protein